MISKFLDTNIQEYIYVKPTIFIGSTSEGADYAKAAKKMLIDVADCKLWTDGIFKLAGDTQRDLVDGIKQSDFVVIFLTADDSTTSRKKEFFSPRDNLIFEAGVGFGALGPSRTFLVPEKVADLKLPSDLAGFTLAKSFVTATNITTAIEASIYQIEERIIELGRKPIIKIDAGREELAASANDLIKSADRHIMLFGRDLSWADVYSDAIRERVDAGIEVEVFAEKPKTDKAKSSIKTLEKAGASVKLLKIDLGIKFTMIDYHEVGVARFMITSKERNPTGSKRRFNYKCEIHDGRESTVLLNSLTRLYKVALREYKRG